MPAVPLERLRCLYCEHEGVLIRDQFGRCIKCQWDEFEVIEDDETETAD